MPSCLKSKRQERLPALYSVSTNEDGTLKLSPKRIHKPYKTLTHSTPWVVPSSRDTFHKKQPSVKLNQFRSPQHQDFSFDQKDNWHQQKQERVYKALEHNPNKDLDRFYQALLRKRLGRNGSATFKVQKIVEQEASGERKSETSTPYKDKNPAILESLECKWNFFKKTPATTPKKRQQQEFEFTVQL